MTRPWGAERNYNDALWSMTSPTEQPSEGASIVAAWTENLAIRRAELVDKKYRSSLTTEEYVEFQHLQKMFGEYLNAVAPLPPQ